MSKADTQNSVAGVERPQTAAAKRFDNKLVPTFLQKTYALVNNKEFQDIVTWGEEPSTFVIYDPNRFAREVLPRHFKQNKMSSFVRQLNMYDFHKKTSQDSKHHIFYHPCFQKGNEHLLAKIKRKKSSKRGNRDNSSLESFSLSDKRKRTRFFEEYRKSRTTLDGLEIKIKELAISFTGLIDDCKGLSLDLNNFKKEIRDKVDIIMYHLYEKLGTAGLRMPTQMGNPAANQLALHEIAVPNPQLQYNQDGLTPEQLLLMNQGRHLVDGSGALPAIDPRAHKTYRVVDEMFPSYREYGGKDIYNMMSKNGGVLPTMSNGARHPSFYQDGYFQNGKIIYHSATAPLEITDREAQLSIPGIEPVSTPHTDLDSILDLNRPVTRNGDSGLGKRLAQINELEYLAGVASPNVRKKSTDPTVEAFMSPVMQGGIAQSPLRLNSPSHSTGSGFRLHPSRKDSELQDFNKEVLLTKSRSFEELPGSSA